MIDTVKDQVNRGTRNTLRPWIWCGAAGILLVPAVAMWLQAPGVSWTRGDFVVMGLLLAVAGGLYELGAWLGGGTAYRAGFGLAVIGGLLTVWANLAVGMLGGEAEPANLLFLGVLAVAALGSLKAAFRPAGMAVAMAATGGAQLVAAGIGLGMGFAVREVVLTACFAAPWLGSAWLFRRARAAVYTRPWQRDR